MSARESFHRHDEETAVVARTGTAIAIPEVNSFILKVVNPQAERDLLESVSDLILEEPTFLRLALRSAYQHPWILDGKRVNPEHKSLEYIRNTFPSLIEFVSDEMLLGSSVTEPRKIYPKAKAHSVLPERLRAKVSEMHSELA